MTSRTEILIIDDEKVLAGTLREFLQSEGYEVTVAHDSKSALEKVENHSFGIVLCDIQLPSMSGLELSKTFEVANGHHLTFRKVWLPWPDNKCLR